MIEEEEARDVEMRDERGIFDKKKEEKNGQKSPRENHVIRYNCVQTMTWWDERRWFDGLEWIRPGWLISRSELSGLDSSRQTLSSSSGSSFGAWAKIRL